MPLPNRVDPFGALFADSARGLFFGNRGGRFHRDDRTLGSRRWVSRTWICCRLAFKGRHRAVWGKGYTELFFLDEPTAGVDLPNQHALADALRQLKDRGATIVLVAHELGPLSALVDRAVVMRDGRIAYDGAPLADHDVHHPDFGEVHTHHHGDPAPARHDHTPHVASPLEPR